MFQLYKKRDFSALVGDTFGFFKLEGKNYFKNYFTINGGLLLLLVVIIYFFSNIFIKGAFAGAQTGNDSEPVGKRWLSAFYAQRNYGRAKRNS